MALFLLHHAFALSDYEEEDNGSAFFTVSTLSIFKDAASLTITYMILMIMPTHKFTVYFAANYFLLFTLLHYCLGDQSVVPSKAKTGICLVSASVFLT